MRKRLLPRLRKRLQRPRSKRIQLICAAYGIGKTELVMSLADAERLPVLLAFFTRQLRDETHAWYSQTFPDRRALKLHSPVEKLAAEFGIDEKEFYAYLEHHKSPYFEMALREHLEHKLLPEDDADHAEIKRIVTRYRQHSRRFKHRLKEFFAGQYDIVFMTQQGLLMRILHANDFTIPDHVRVVLDELEVALWASGEVTPLQNRKARAALKAGGRWTILTGDSRPIRFHMPRQFHIVNLLEKQWIDPVALHTHMPLGWGNKVKVFRPTRSPARRAQFEAKAAKENHRNREVALPLIVAEEKARAKQAGQVPVFVGNVGQHQFPELGIRTFESMKGANWLWKSEESYRIVVIGTCPHPEVLEQNSLLFGTSRFTEFAKRGRDKSGWTPPREWQDALQKEQEALLEGDLLDKVAQIVGRVRGFRSRPDCEVVVYLWNRQAAHYVQGKLPFVWLDPPAPQASLVGRIYHSGRPLNGQVRKLADEVRRLKIAKLALRTNAEFQAVQGSLRCNLGRVCDDLLRRHPRLGRHLQTQSSDDPPTADDF
jgi:hypothetical protein